jgi:hypothetical protein
MLETTRFTLDGNDELEAHLARTCDRVLAGVCSIVPTSKLEGVLLGGGYGRGEGGVLKTDDGDRPYNDMEFYILMRGPSWINERKFRTRLHHLCEELSPEAGLEIEFKIVSLQKLETSPITMHYYDLIAGHRRLWGGKDLLRRCRQHRVPNTLPLSEATRLLMNRSSGLLFSSSLLQKSTFTVEDADFVGRNQAKAQLAFGDVVLTAFGQYHASCRERNRRLRTLTTTEKLPWLETIRRHHNTGVDFKLHPQKTTLSREELLERQHDLVCTALQLWLWLEQRRLRQRFSTAVEYALCPINKCPETNVTRNILVNASTFGAPAILKDKAFRYPRERLFNALSLLLWEPSTIRQRDLLHDVQRELVTDATAFDGLISAYQNLWRRFS